jgi:hypothetical protein
MGRSRGLRSTSGLGGVLGAIVALACLGGLPGDAAAEHPVWLCKPGKQHNPCSTGLKTTLISPSGERLGVKNPKRRKPPKVDCFYVYPTVSDQQTPNANLHIDPEQRSIALYQAARYSQYCRVFAPMYRQLTLKALFDGQPITDHMRWTAYKSAADAWQTYLRDYNHGRGVVLIGHSQGTFVLRQLITKRIDPKPSLRGRLISALLLGGNVTVKHGRSLGGDFKHVRACGSLEQLHCVVAFSTFNATVPADAVFGRTSEPGLRVLCTNPAALGGGSARLGSVYPTAPFAPGTTIGAGTSLIGLPDTTATTPWVKTMAYRGECSSAGGANVLQLTDLPGAPHLHAIPDATWGLHLADANIALGNLSRLVGKQAARYLSEHR